MKKNDMRANPAAPEKSKVAAKINDEVWLDFVENEVDETFKNDLSLLLMNSQADQQQVETIKKLRGLIKGSDEVLLPEDGRVYQNLHDKIMAATENMQPGTAVREDEEVASVTFMSRFTRKRTAVGASSLMAIALAMFAWFGANQQLDSVQMQTASQVEQPNEAAILAESAASNDSINDEVLATVAADEFIADAASQKIASLSDQDYAALLDDLRN